MLSKVQFNTADQDFVAITLLEAAVAGCYPLYPYFRSFPETLRYSQDYTYNRLDIYDASKKIQNIMHSPHYMWDKDHIMSRNWIYERFDNSWKRMTDIMLKGSTSENNPYAY